MLLLTRYSCGANPIFITIENHLDRSFKKIC